jgi:hypothetical protein
MECLICVYHIRYTEDIRTFNGNAYRRGKIKHSGDKQ